MESRTQRGQILKDLRIKKGLKQSDIADYLEITQQAYQRYEYGTSEPNSDGYIKLADFYGVSVDYLLGREPVPDPLPLLVAKTNVSKEELEKQFDALPEEGKAIMMTVIRMLKNNRETSNKE